MAKASEFADIPLDTALIVKFSSFTFQARYGGIEGDNIKLVRCLSGGQDYGTQDRPLSAIESWTTLEAVMLAQIWMCGECGWYYDAKAGVPEQGIAPNTPWMRVPEEKALCPKCGSNAVLCLDR